MSRSTRTSSHKTALALAAFAMLLGVLCVVPSALAQGGGVGTPPPPPAGTCDPSQPLPKGHIINHVAYAPSCAPQLVKDAIYAGNQIRKKHYRMGGGHQMPWKVRRFYDCSGTVSWLLHGARRISKPKTSGQLAKWRASGRGRWITVRANSGHTYIVVAGLRMDTSGTGGNGPRWTKRDPFTRTNGPFKTRHPQGL